MGSTGSENYDNEYMSANAAMLNNQAALSNAQLQNYNAISPQLTEVQKAQLSQDLKNAQSPVYDWMRTQSNTLTGQMPTYNTNIGLDSPETQKFSDIYDKSMQAQMDAAQRKIDSDVAGKNMFGSSYQAGKQAELGNLKAQTEAQNKTNSLSAAQSTQSNNLNTWMGLLSALTQTPEYQLPNAPNLPSPYNYTGLSPMTSIFGSMVGDTIGALTKLSDKKCKQNIKKLGTKNGINIYEFEYKSEYNLPKGKYIGVMAQEVEHIKGAVTEINGLKHVDYSVILPLVA